MKWRGSNPLEQNAPVTSLKQELAERKAQIEKYVPEESRALNRRAVEEIRASGIRERVLPKGAKAHAFSLPDHDGKEASSAALLVRGPLIVVFFRGRWCPFCVGQLEAMNYALPQIEHAGAGLVAVSPQTAKQNSLMRDQHQLRFPLLSDVANRVARQFGLVYRVPGYQQQQYSKTFVNLPFLNGDSSWELPIPATFAIAPDSTVLQVFADPDYTQRPEPDDVLAVLGA